METIFRYREETFFFSKETNANLIPLVFPFFFFFFFFLDDEIGKWI